MARAAILLGLFLASCATADPVNFANGQSGYAIRCDFGLNGLDQCFAKAGAVCANRGYTLHDWQGKPLTYSMVQQNFDVGFSTLGAKTILAQCNP